MNENSGASKLFRVPCPLSPKSTILPPLVADSVEIRHSGSKDSRHHSPHYRRQIERLGLKSIKNPKLSFKKTSIILSCKSDLGT